MCGLFLCSFSVLWILPAMMQALFSGAEIFRPPTAYFFIGMCGKYMDPWGKQSFPNQLQRLIEQSGHCSSIWRVSLLSWAAGRLFTSVWTEPKKKVDTCSMVLVGCLVLGAVFLWGRAIWDLALLKHWKDWRMETWLLVLWKPLFTEVTKGEILVHSKILMFILPLVTVDPDWQCIHLPWL